MDDNPFMLFEETTLLNGENDANITTTEEMGSFITKIGCDPESFRPVLEVMPNGVLCRFGDYGAYFTPITAVLFGRALIEAGATPVGDRPELDG
jgi:hypothetical protein